MLGTSRYLQWIGSWNGHWNDLDIFQHDFQQSWTRKLSAALAMGNQSSVPDDGGEPKVWAELLYYGPIISYKWNYDSFK